MSLLSFKRRQAAFYLLRHSYYILRAWGLIMCLGISTACAASPQQQGRYILYVDTTTLTTLKSPQGQQSQLTEWGKTLGGELKLERELATGGWVFTVTSPATSSEQQMHGLQQLPGVESVERDTLMRHY